MKRICSGICLAILVAVVIPFPQRDCHFSVSSHRGVGPYGPEAGNRESNRSNQSMPAPRMAG